ncbi:MAG: hypothetical protein JWN27_2457, partial [Candidatus Eremiobacteraeota bacterium]|nr:hypothetical protein [Candidatus Eremiobacteraeota bacterium]
RSGLTMLSTSTLAGGFIIALGTEVFLDLYAH